MNDKVTVTLDSENIPKEFVQLPIDLSYSMTYNELYVVQGTKPSKADEEDSQEDTLEHIGRESTVESVFKVNKETLESEYNLITLNLEKIKVINLRDVVSRGEKAIQPADLQYITEGSFHLSRKSGRDAQETRSVAPF